VTESSEIGIVALETTGAFVAAVFVVEQPAAAVFVVEQPAAAVFVVEQPAAVSVVVAGFE